jgi:membrane protease YdiL (CAAX protease family)
MLFQFAALFIREFARLRMQEYGVTAESAAHFSALIGFVVLVVLMWPLLYEQRAAVARLFRSPESWTGMAGVALAIGLALRAASWCLIIAATGLGITTLPDGPGISGSLLTWRCPPVSSLLLSFAVLAVLTPLFEETINRGVILSTLRHRRVRGAVFISAGLFAVLHAADSIAFAFIFGVVAAIQVIHSKTLWAPIVSHATFNGMVAFDWDCLKGVWSPAFTSPVVGIASALLAGLLIGLALWLARSKAPGPATGPGTLSH